MSEEFQRMQELAGINEMKVNIPISLSKDKIIDYFLNKSPALFASATQAPSIKEFYKDYGYDSLDEFLIYIV